MSRRQLWRDLKQSSKNVQVFFEQGEQTLSNNLKQGRSKWWKFLMCNFYVRGGGRGVIYRNFNWV